MRVLVLTQVLVYPADAGPKIQTLQVLRYLAAHHEVTYCTCVRGERHAQDAKHLREICPRIVTVPMKRSRVTDARILLESLVTGDSFLLRRDYRAAMQAEVRRLLLEEEIEVIHVDQLNMMRFVPSDWGGTVILDEHNAVWQVVERLARRASNPLVRWMLGREVGLVRKLEGEACRRAHAVLAVSQHDARALQEVAIGPSQLEVVPIAVDAEQFRNACNSLLEREVSAYRFVGNEIAPTTNANELTEIDGALANTKAPRLVGVNEHLDSALPTLSDRRSPDYRNSIKESISDVESLCRLIAGDRATLG